jgi:hypothetical protein
MEIYEERAACVAAMVAAAESKGWRCCWWIDPEQGLDWPVVCIELPTGQVTWHFSKRDFEAHGLDRLEQVRNDHWDLHTTKDKYDRLAACDWGDAPVNHPSHYNQGQKDADGTATFEAIKVIEDWGFGEGFTVGNALKYLSRAKFKGSEKVDIKKAAWYLRRAHEEGAKSPVTHLRRFRPNEVIRAWGLTGKLEEAALLMVRGKYDLAAKALESRADEL